MRWFLFKKSRNKKLFLPVFFFFSTASNLWSLPQSPDIVFGNAEVSQTASHLEIQSNSDALIDWATFWIDSHESVSFLQPSEENIVINRVLQAEPSLILGQLSSNGKIVLCNPNGLIVGKEARIDASSLIASTLPLKLNDWIKNKHIAFEGESNSSLILDGTIQVKEGLFLSQSLSQKGSLSASDSLFLISPHSAFLKDGDIHQSEFSRSSKGLLEIEGAISCPGGKIEATAANLMIKDTASLSVDSNSGGGILRIGGASLPEANSVYIARGAVLSSNALKNGDGGEIVVWAKERTEVYGSFAAKGGRERGNGGFIETSSPGFLVFQGAADTLSPFGSPGELLLDPCNITIGAFGATNPPPLVANYNPVFAGTAQVDTGQLSVLLGGTSVTIATSNGSGGSGLILVQDPFSWAGMTTLSLIADGDLLINADITSNSNDGRIVLVSQTGNVRIEATATQSAQVHLLGQITNVAIPAITVSAPNGSLVMISQPGFRTHLHSQNPTASGNIVIQTKGVDVTVNSTAANPSNAEIRSFSGDISLAVDGDIVLKAGTGNGGLFGGVNINAGQDQNGPVYGGSVSIVAHNLIEDTTLATGGNGSVSINSFRLLPHSLGNMSIQVSQDVQLISGPGDFADSTIASFNNANLDMQIGGNLTLLVTANTTINAFTVSAIGTDFGGPGQGILNLSVGGNLLMQGGAPTGGIGSAFASISGGSAANISIGGSATILSGNPPVGSTANAIVQSSGGDLNFIADSLLTVGDPNSGNVQMAGNTNTNIAVRGNIDATLTLMGGQDDTNIASSQGNISVANQSVLIANNGNLHLFAGQAISFDFSSAIAGSSITAIAGTNLSFLNLSSATTFNGPITLVADNRFPSPPLIGAGAFIIDSTSFIDASGLPISIYTALQSLNLISSSAIFNGFLFVPGSLFIDTSQEVWCTYYPAGTTSFPFTIFYKDCIGQVSANAEVIVTEFLWDLQEKFPGWTETFSIKVKNIDAPSLFIFEENYYLKRIRRQVINHPKSWTAL